MSAFDRLEHRLLDMSLRGAQDNAEANVVVGLFKAAPAESHDGKYGQFGEPSSAATGGTGYLRSRATFNRAMVGPDGRMYCANAQPITITGLQPGTYTHFGVFGSTRGGAA